MKNWQSVALSGNGEIVAVASRDQAKAQAWIDECSGHVPFPSKPEAVEGYDALLAREDIDAVYVPLPTGVRREWIIKAAKAGKHVLAEKPCGVDVAEVEEVLAADHCQRILGVDHRRSWNPRLAWARLQGA